MSSYVFRQHGDGDGAFLPRLAPFLPPAGLPRSLPRGGLGPALSYFPPSTRPQPPEPPRITTHSARKIPHNQGMLIPFSISFLKVS